MTKPKSRQRASKPRPAVSWTPSDDKFLQHLLQLIGDLRRPAKPRPVKKAKTQRKKRKAHLPETQTATPPQPTDPGLPPPSPAPHPTAKSPHATGKSPHPNPKPSSPIPKPPQATARPFHASGKPPLALENKPTMASGSEALSKEVEVRNGHMEGVLRMSLAEETVGGPLQGFEPQDPFEPEQEQDFLRKIFSLIQPSENEAEKKQFSNWIKIYLNELKRKKETIENPKVPGHFRKMHPGTIDDPGCSHLKVCYFIYDDSGKGGIDPTVMARRYEKANLLEVQAQFSEG